ncbi:hypothetical protein M378DRAFT_1067799 [Amanita muscaria Koide BX008]|uniref:Uncharacterized protein n=1 Tax=Amanita muscaria (strain Koide BX008) TaxID=946122 RepID=A0A0C2WT75_AMAMK|nr:hypothetical protein M378DRAFT_1067799 [Amanita muscaria Koide BX008]
MRVVDFKRVIPKPIVVEVRINGQAARALIDSGSEADFLSTTLADQLKLRKDLLAKQLNIHLAVHGSRSKTNASVLVNFQYQGIDESRRFDVSNLDNYDIILGTPFWYQHKVLGGLNPTRVIIGSDASLPMSGDEVNVVQSAAADVFEDDLERICAMLKHEAKDLCPDTANTALPPFRAVNHTIPLIDEDKVYRYRTARCPEALKGLWQKKRDEYLLNGRWRRATGNPSAPLLNSYCA